MNSSNEVWIDNPVCINPIKARRIIKAVHRASWIKLQLHISYCKFFADFRKSGLIIIRVKTKNPIIGLDLIIRDSQVRVRIIQIGNVSIPLILLIRIYFKKKVSGATWYFLFLGRVRFGTDRRRGAGLKKPFQEWFWTDLRIYLIF